MLTITTTARLGALRERADRAETALTDTVRRLEELQEEHHGCGPVLRAARTDLKTALADSGQTLAAEAIASEARTRSVCDFLVKNAATQLADRDRTITALRAELEQDRTGQPADPELPEHTVVQFRTLGGGLVALIAEPDEDRVDDARIYGYQCLTCGDRASGAYRMEDGRRWANEHAAVCRALPAGTTTTKKKEGAR